MAAAILVLLALLVPATTEIEFLTQDLPWAIADKGYEAPPLEVRVSGTCPHGGVGYAVTKGTLPPGIQISRLGYFSGAPLHTGEFKFTLHASDGCGSAEKQFTLVVTGAPVLTVAPLRIVFVCKAGEIPAAQELGVSATWPRLPYLLSSDASWLAATPEHGATPREGAAMTKDVVHMRADATGMKAGHYSASITVSSWQALEPVRVAVELTVN